MQTTMYSAMCQHQDVHVRSVRVRLCHQHDVGLPSRHVVDARETLTDVDLRVELHVQFVRDWAHMYRRVHQLHRSQDEQAESDRLRRDTVRAVRTVVHAAACPLRLRTWGVFCDVSGSTQFNSACTVVHRCKWNRG